MRITDIRDLAVKMEGNVANAFVSFAEHDISLVALVSDVVRDGKPLVGYAFDSIGRFAQSGILRDRMIPRLRRAAPESLLSGDGKLFDPAKVLQTIMRNEKPAGHGDRAAAAAAIELAVWDLNAKILDVPAHVLISRAFGGRGKADGIEVYAAGGYYYANESGATLKDELQSYADMGFSSFKMKIGGASLKEDIARIESALTVVDGDGSRLAVDANGRFDLKTALAYAEAIAPYQLRWFEEIGDPLDYDLNRRVAEAYPSRIATGENLFSAQDIKNLALYGGMRRGLDYFQMDPGLSYGLTEFAHAVAVLEEQGYERSQVHPHGGHMINLHIAAGLGLGGCEAYPGVFQPFGGYAPECSLGGGMVHPTQAPGFGLEQKRELAPWLEKIIG
ncbi:enolase C-terminal domain-like protein [Herbaspirillum chlorophenolicum]|uniref:enolase C-terminal domain-like protein n=1 Tax=Herbaspirillum chlorophenolicum TaxID=211589 RepID=UPI00067B7981|nr:enolase C-terminal domain-like protein [Herbaspirillum chlorophenolicum]